MKDKRSKKDTHSKNAGRKLRSRMIRDVFHVGAKPGIERPKKSRLSYEGGGLSVSLHPDEWRRIARLGGAPTWRLSHSGSPRFLIWSKRSQDIANAWGIESGFLRPLAWYAVSYWDDEWEREFTERFDDADEAQDEADERGVEVQEQKGYGFGEAGSAWWSDTFALPTDDHLAEDMAFVAYAEASGYDGAWWDEDLDVDRLSAPRGVVFRPSDWSWSRESDHPRSPAANPGRWYFHGSPYVDEFLAELRSTGEVWIEPRGKSTGLESYWYDQDALLEPIVGRVYLTTDMNRALEYARCGVVLLVSVEDGVDVWPDEDCLGVALQYASTEGGERGALDPRFVWDDPEAERELRRVYDALPLEIQDMYQELAEPDVFWLAAAGKFALLRSDLDPKLVRRLARICDAVSVPGPVRVTGAYVLDPAAWRNYKLVVGEDDRLPPTLVGGTYISAMGDGDQAENPATKPSKYTLRYREIYGSGGDLDTVSEQTGISRSLLQRVYDRGLAAWEKSHRPGTAQHQWAMARVYSFAVGGKTWDTTDADLAREARRGGFRPRANPGPLAESITRILESGGVYLDAPLTELGQGVEVYAYESLIGERVVVAKLYQSPSSSTQAAARALVHQGRLGRPATGLVEVLAICETDEGIVVVQERATLCAELDLPGADRMGSYAAPVVAEALEEAIQSMAEGWEPSDALAAKFRRQLISGARVLGGRRAELELVVEWHPLNVGVVLRRGVPKAVIFDFGAP